MSGTVRLGLEASSARFDAGDDRWLDQVSALVGDLRREVGDVSVAREPILGAKGAVGSIVLSLASAGSLTALVELLKSWLGRDRSRSLKATWSLDGKLQEVELSGNRVDDTAFDDLVQAVIRQVADSG